MMRVMMMMVVMRIGVGVGRRGDGEDNADENNDGLW